MRTTPLRTPETAGPLWAVTSYFNPSGFRSRRKNYEVFREQLNVPLLTVELTFDNTFELAQGAADILIQRRDGDLMWQKERLLNMAIARLPDSCEAVAWLDCDVVFTQDGWARQALDELERHALIQPFERLVHLPQGQVGAPQSEPGPEQIRRSFASAYLRGALPDDVFLHPDVTAKIRTNCGMAWVARRELLARHRLYDSMILGMGDKHIAAAAVGQAADAAKCTNMSDAHTTHFTAWADGFTADVQARLGHIAGTIYHLWHGNLIDRNYVDRYREFSGLGFDPAHDLQCDGDSPWRWGRRSPRLHAHVASYFDSRYEDAEPRADWAASYLPVELTS